MGTWGVVPSLSHIIAVAACPTCYSLDTARRPLKDFLPSIPGFGGSFWSISMTLSNACLSDKAGCQFCAILSRIFRRILANDSDAVYFTEGRARVRVPIDPSFFGSFRVICYYKAVQPGSDLLQQKSKVYYLSVVRRCRNGPLRALREGGYIPSNPLSELCFRKVSSWMQDCIHTHSSMDCRSKRSGLFGYVPVRLIAVGARAALPKIVEPQGIVVDYIALSYCWGTANILKTTTANLPDRRRFMPWDSLPKVFQDAIVLTRALGLKYIWIDAICIQQDDAEDLNRQLSQMAQIYHEAYLVISADSAHNADDRLFKERPRSLHLRSQSSKQPTEVSEVLFHDGIDHETLGGRSPSGSNWPLAKRGWTLQERFLATRILHISPLELVWECNERLRCECKYMDQQGVAQDVSWTSLRTRYIQAPDVDTSEDERVECWCLIVREYSGRKFSNDSDRLVAISGLASQFGKLGIGQYRAGVWSNHVLRMISWNRHPDTPGRRPTEYVAPSWSWASVVGQIDWEYSKDWDFSDTLPANDRQFIGLVLGIECYPSGADLFGSVCGGYLTLSVLTLTVTVQSIKDGDRQLELPVRHTLILDVDSPTEATELLDVGWVKCVFLETSGLMDARALVLKSSRSDLGVFTRIGRLFIEGSDREKLPAFATEVLTIY